MLGMVAVMFLGGERHSAQTGAEREAPPTTEAGACGLPGLPASPLVPAPPSFGGRGRG